jgi:hypothetical protein
MITIVKYMAFAKPHEKCFYKGEPFEQIHHVLNDICNTYVVMEIIQCSELENQPLNKLTKYQKDDNK